jgi:hypothetical protein
VECRIQSGVVHADSTQIQKLRDLVGAAGSSDESKLLAQAVLDLNDAVRGLLKTAEGQPKQKAFRVGG